MKRLKVNGQLLDELAMAFKGLTKFEIDNLWPWPIQTMENLLVVIWK